MLVLSTLIIQVLIKLFIYILNYLLTNIIFCFINVVWSMWQI